MEQRILIFLIFFGLVAHVVFSQKIRAPQFSFPKQPKPPSLPDVNNFKTKIASLIAKAHAKFGTSGLKKLKFSSSFTSTSTSQTGHPLALAGSNNGGQQKLTKASFNSLKQTQTIKNYGKPQFGAPVAAVNVKLGQRPQSGQPLVQNPPQVPPFGNNKVTQQSFIQSKAKIALQSQSSKLGYRPQNNNAFVQPVPSVHPATRSQPVVRAPPPVPRGLPLSRVAPPIARRPPIVRGTPDKYSQVVPGKALPKVVIPVPPPTTVTKFRKGPKLVAQKHQIAFSQQETQRKMGKALQQQRKSQFQRNEGVALQQQGRQQGPHSLWKTPHSISTNMNNGVGLKQQWQYKQTSQWTGNFGTPTKSQTSTSGRGIAPQQQQQWNTGKEIQNLSVKNGEGLQHSGSQGITLKQENRKGSSWQQQQQTAMNGIALKQIPQTQINTGTPILMQQQQSTQQQNKVNGISLQQIGGNTGFQKKQKAQSLPGVSIQQPQQRSMLGNPIQLQQKSMIGIPTPLQQKSVIGNPITQQPQASIGKPLKSKQQSQSISRGVPLQQQMTGNTVQQIQSKSGSASKQNSGGIALHPLAVGGSGNNQSPQNMPGKAIQNNRKKASSSPTNSTSTDKKVLAAMISQTKLKIGQTENALLKADLKNRIAQAGKALKQIGSTKQTASLTNNNIPGKGLMSSFDTSKSMPGKTGKALGLSPFSSGGTPMIRSELSGKALKMTMTSGQSATGGTRGQALTGQIGQTTAKGIRSGSRTVQLNVGRLGVGQQENARGVSTGTNNSFRSGEGLKALYDKSSLTSTDQRGKTLIKQVGQSIQSGQAIKAASSSFEQPGQSLTVSAGDNNGFVGAFPGQAIKSSSTVRSSSTSFGKKLNSRNPEGFNGKTEQILTEQSPRRKESRGTTGKFMMINGNRGSSGSAGHPLAATLGQKASESQSGMLLFGKSLEGQTGNNRIQAGKNGLSGQALEKSLPGVSSFENKKRMSLTGQSDKSIYTRHVLKAQPFGQSTSGVQSVISSKGKSSRSGTGSTSIGRPLSESPSGMPLFGQSLKAQSDNNGNQATKSYKTTSSSRSSLGIKTGISPMGHKKPSGFGDYELRASSSIRSLSGAQSGLPIVGQSEHRKLSGHALKAPLSGRSLSETQNGIPFSFDNGKQVSKTIKGTSSNRPLIGTQTGISLMGQPGQSGFTGQALKAPGHLNELPLPGQPDQRGFSGQAISPTSLDRSSSGSKSGIPRAGQSSGSGFAGQPLKTQLSGRSLSGTESRMPLFGQSLRSKSGNQDSQSRFTGQDPKASTGRFWSGSQSGIPLSGQSFDDQSRNNDNKAGKSGIAGQALKASSIGSLPKPYKISSGISSADDRSGMTEQSFRRQSGNKSTKSRIPGQAIQATSDQSSSGPQFGKPLMGQSDQGVFSGQALKSTSGRPSSGSRIGMPLTATQLRNRSGNNEKQVGQRGFTGQALMAMSIGSSDLSGRSGQALTARIDNSSPGKSGVPLFGQIDNGGLAVGEFSSDFRSPAKETKIESVVTGTSGQALHSSHSDSSLGSNGQSGVPLNGQSVRGYSTSQSFKASFTSGSTGQAGPSRFSGHALLASSDVSSFSSGKNGKPLVGKSGYESGYDINGADANAGPSRFSGHALLASSDVSSFSSGKNGKPLVGKSGYESGYDINGAAEAGQSGTAGQAIMAQSGSSSTQSFSGQRGKALTLPKSSDSTRNKDRKEDNGGAQTGQRGSYAQEIAASSGLSTSVSQEQGGKSPRQGVKGSSSKKQNTQIGIQLLKPSEKSPLGPSGNVGKSTVSQSSGLGSQSPPENQFSYTAKLATESKPDRQTTRQLGPASSGKTNSQIGSGTGIAHPLDKSGKLQPNQGQGSKSGGVNLNLSFLQNQLGKSRTGLTQPADHPLGPSDSSYTGASTSNQNAGPVAPVAGGIDLNNSTAPSQPAKCTCPVNYAPVCGSDGFTYDNDCEITCAGVSKECDTQCPCPTAVPAQPVTSAPSQTIPFVEVVPQLESQPMTQPASVLEYGLCEIGCSDVDNPSYYECGVDGQVYKNACFRRCQNIEKACDGECPCSGSFNMGYFPMFVPFYSDEGFNPVCSTEGNQYNNMQALRAAGEELACSSHCPC